MRFGNLCIAAHNYKNGTFFSNLSELEAGDNIIIYDNKGKILNYEVYDVSKVKPSDLSPTTQDTNNLRIITLVTCDTNNDNYRTIVKAKEIT